MFRTFRRPVAALVVAAGGSKLQDGGPAAVVKPQVDLPPHLYPTWDSQNVTLTADAAFAAAGSAVLLSLVVGPGRRAVFRSLGIFVDAPAVSTRAQWRVRVNGVVVPGLEKVTYIPRAASSFSRSFDVIVIAPPGALVEVVGENLDGAPSRLGATLDGWTYPLDIGAH